MREPRLRLARAEATSLLPVGYEARVLEPSPPASTDPVWYADDPTDPAGARAAVVTPIPEEGVSWDAMTETYPELGGYASDHWLTDRRRLKPLPMDFHPTRAALHQIAFFVLAPARHAATGKLGLRYTHLGFGTPFFGADEQVRVEGDLLVHQGRDEVRYTSLTSLGRACGFLDIPYREVWFEDFVDPLAPIGASTDLEVNAKAADAIAEWFGFATLILERMRRIEGAEDVGRVQVWPEHFDVAVEMGSHEEGQRASYGASAGDDHLEPYLYVSPWSDVDRRDRFWNDPTFDGASLSYRRLLDSPDQHQAALDFLSGGYVRLTGRSTS